MNINNELGQIKKDLMKAFMGEFEKIYDSELSAKIVNNIMGEYSKLPSPNYDPVTPEKAAAYFKTLISQTLKDTFTLDTSSGAINFSTGDKEELEYSSTKEARESKLRKRGVKRPRPTYWLQFYLEGVIGKYYFVTKEDYKKLYDLGIVSKKALGNFDDWGWFNNGFLIPAGDSLQKKLKAAGVVLNIHPFSGMSPIDVFSKGMPTEQEMEGYFGLALERALEKVG